MSDLLKRIYEQSMDIIEIYRKGKTWYLRGITEAQRRMYNISDRWQNGMDKKSPVFITDSSDIAQGTIKYLRLTAGEGSEIGTEESYSNR